MNPVKALYELLCFFVSLVYVRLLGYRKKISYVGKHVVVTGAASGIGRATAEELLARGTHVYCLDINERALTEIYKDQPNATTIGVDVTNTDSVKNAAKVVAAKTGNSGLFGLINCAGIVDLEGMSKGLFEVSEAGMNKVMGVNFFGTTKCVNAFTPLMIQYNKSKIVAHETPSIVNVASVAGLNALPFAGYYSASKYAVVGYTDCLRRELSYLDIRVTCVEPGFVDTPLLGFQLQPDPTSALYFEFKRIETADVQGLLKHVAQPVGHVSAAIRESLVQTPAPEHVVVDKLRMRVVFWLVIHVLPHWLTDFTSKKLRSLKN